MVRPPVLALPQPLLAQLCVWVSKDGGGPLQDEVPALCLERHCEHSNSRTGPDNTCLKLTTWLRLLAVHSHLLTTLHICPDATPLQLTAHCDTAQG